MMKNNNKKLLNNLQNNYLSYIPSIEKVDEINALAAQEGEYFFECPIHFIFYIPSSKESDNLHPIDRLSLSYVFQIYKNENKKYEIAFNDINRPNIKIQQYYANDLVDAIDPNKNFESLLEAEEIYFKSFHETSFANFSLDTASKEFDKFFKGINEQTFFDFKVNKNKVLLNKNLLSQLQKNFYSTLADFLEKMEQKDFLSLSEKYERNIEVFEKFSSAIKNSEKHYEYEKLKSSLNETSLGSKNERKKNKV